MKPLRVDFLCEINAPYSAVTSVTPRHTGGPRRAFGHRCTCIFSRNYLLALNFGNRLATVALFPLLSRTHCRFILLFVCLRSFAAVELAWVFGLVHREKRDTLRKLGRRRNEGGRSVCRCLCGLLWFSRTMYLLSCAQTEVGIVTAVINFAMDMDRTQ